MKKEIVCTFVLSAIFFPAIAADGVGVNNLTAAKVYKCRNGESTYLTDKKCSVGYKQERGEWVGIEEERDSKYNGERFLGSEEEKRRRNAVQLSRAIEQVKSQNGPDTDSNPRRKGNSVFLESSMETVAVHCPKEYSRRGHRFEQYYIIVTDKTGATYDITPRVHFAAGRNGWSDGEKRFTSEQISMLRRYAMANIC